MNKRRMSATAAVIALCVTLASCVAADCAARAERQPPPVSAAGRTLSARVSVRFLTPHSVNLVVYLAARRRLHLVRVRASALDRRLSVPKGCTFQPLSPPRRASARHPPLPLPVVPLCSLVLVAAQPGRYAVDVRVTDGLGHDLVGPIRTVIRIGSKPQ